MIEGGWCVLFNSLKVQETPASLVSNVFGGVPIYRTMYFPVPTGRTKDLDIYVWPMPLQGVTAAFATSQPGPLGLPGSDTTITASASTPAGINFLGSSDSGVGLNFNLMSSPDTTSNLGSLMST